MWKLAFLVIFASFVGVSEVQEVNHLTSGISESISRLEFQQKLYPAAKTATLR